MDTHTHVHGFPYPRTWVRMPKALGKDAPHSWAKMPKVLGNCGHNYLLTDTFITFKLTITLENGLYEEC